jgi:16S rRNA (guanine1516-N2)-methyltransferase
MELKSIAFINKSGNPDFDSVDPEFYSYVRSSVEEEADYLLVRTSECLELRESGKNSIKPVRVDFLSSELSYRRRAGGGVRQGIARAVGLKKGFRPHVFDATAGLGTDGFILASLGCYVSLVERSPVVFALLADGLERALLDPDVGRIVEKQLELIHGDALDVLNNLSTEQLPDVVYLDPMFPERKKKAGVKKEMRVLRNLAGNDSDSSKLLDISLQKALKRVVVKRPRLAKSITGPAPAMHIDGKSSRFDIYLVDRL